MTIAEKLKCVVLPSLIAIGLGILEIKFPHAMDNFDDAYTGSGTAGLVLLIFEMLLWLTWGKIGGSIVILLGVAAMVSCLLPDKEKVAEPSVESPVVLTEQPLPTVSSVAFRAGKALIRRRLRNRQP